MPGKADKPSVSTAPAAPAKPAQKGAN
jgi:hypothetical protein